MKRIALTLLVVALAAGACSNNITGPDDASIEATGGNLEATGGN